MELKLMNASFEEIHILDTFKSLIWTDRYYLCGDFDLLVDPSDNLLTILENVKYLNLEESKHMMFLETFAIDTDIEDGPMLILKGRSLESFLDRRVIGSPITIDGNLQSGIQTLLNDNVISPTDTDREISNVSFLVSEDPAITTLTLDTQFSGKTLYEIISDICTSKEIGFEVLLTSGGDFQFGLYAGADRSYEQSANPHVVFSPEFDNLLNGSYIESSKLEKTHVYVVGEEGVGNTRTLVIVPVSGTPPTGLNRREMYFEANIIRNTPAGILTDAEYIDQLTSRGVEELAKNVYVKAFDGEVDTSMYSFGDDFFMGDILQLMDKYGHSTQSRVIEIIFSQDPAGVKIYPTFNTKE